jgi:hypothetical protein
MALLRLNPILTAASTLVIGIMVGCGGDTSKDQGESFQADVSTGGAQASGGGGGRVSDGGQTSTGGQGGSGGSAGPIGSGGTGGMVASPLFPIYVTLDRGPGAGYCIQPGDILQASISCGELGNYWMSGTVFREWDVSRPDACWGIQSPDCVVSEEFDLMLTATQAAELGPRLAVLPEDRCEVDEMMECDPCVITTLVIDGTTYSDYCCGTQLSAGYDEAFQAVVESLDDLAAEGG